MRILFVVLAMLALVAAAVAYAARRPRDFRPEMMALFTRAMPGATLTADPEDPLAILFKRADGSEGQFYLDTLAGYCRTASAKDCAATKADYVSKMSRVQADPTPADLRLIVRDRAYLDHVDAMREKAPEKGDVAKYHSIGADLYAVLAADGDEVVRLIGDVGLTRLGLPVDEAWALAEAQTRALLPRLPTPAKLRQSAIIFQGQDYLASLLIDLPRWQALSAKVGPDLFITVVADHTVFVAQGPDGPQLDKFKKAVAEDCAAQERCISPNVYRFRNGRWAIAD